MDAKNVFIAGERYIGRINWVLTDGSEWYYVGVGDDYNEEKVEAFLQRHFGEAELFLIIDRHRVETCPAATAARVIKTLFASNGLTVSNRDFTKMMVFNKIGVMKYGSRI
ncbi:hypothetical protein [Chitinophaga varians]|uniref:hypothetical protein n=1 Tax=Chitinophaga varians TaxID=2202339 RepID=UPI00165ED711|nr:hypothetical protein [Chitinophaga varians]MBC9914282.1 hypothetical protein [Chitinophaga varians]